MAKKKAVKKKAPISREDYSLSNRIVLLEMRMAELQAQVAKLVPFSNALANLQASVNDVIAALMKGPKE